MSDATPMSTTPPAGPAAETGETGRMTMDASSQMPEQTGDAALVIDCGDCRMQHTTACQDCVVTHLLRDLAGPIEVDPDQAEAIELLSEAGLISPLRMVPQGGERDAAAG